MNLELVGQTYNYDFNCLKENTKIKDVKGIKVKVKQISLKKDKLEENTVNEIIGAEKKKIVPTDIGVVVNEFMEKYFNSLIDAK